MTDNEIIKALEVCASPQYSCECCLYLGKCRSLEKDALNLIKRQRAEIERLEKCCALAVAEREANVKGFIESLKEAEGHNDPVGERGECGLKSQCLAEANAELDKLQAEIERLKEFEYMYNELCK